jgi:hypothetical protein
MKSLTYSMVMVLFLIVAGLAPADASVTKDTFVDTVNIKNYSMPIAPDALATCDYQRTETVTWWRNPDIEMQSWKTDYSIVTEGICKDGTRFTCGKRYAANEQFTFGYRATVISENCWFYYPDGTAAKRLFQFTYANGETRANITEKWN